MDSNPPSRPAPHRPAPPPGIAREISREALAALPIRRYDGDVVLVETPEDFARAREALASERAVGWDTETRPAFRVGESYLPSLVQVATSRTVYLFQLSRMDFAPLVGGLFAEAAIVKPGISVADDLAKLKRLFPFEERSVLDLGAVARRRGLKQTGLRNLAAIFLGFRIPKGTKTTNWAAKRLSAEQVTYAATDAWGCRELYLRFEALGMLAPA
jgi:ribonuclease D